MAHSVLRSRRAHRLVFAALSASAAFLPGVAWAQCVNTPTSGTTVSIACTGTAAAFSNTAASGVTVTVASGATVSAPLVIGTALASTGNVLNNSGSISGTGAAFTVQFGNGATINNGTSSLHTASITATGATTGAGAISLGNNGTVNNYGTLTAMAGTPAVQFGSAGTFNNDASATAAVSGNIVFGTTNGPAISTFNNYNTAYGITGSVLATGNVLVNNAGLWTGNFTQTTVGNSNTATVINGTSSGSQTGITFTGVLATQDPTALTNYATMYLYSGSAIGSATTGSTVVNNGTLTIGSPTASAALTINGNFTQNSGATLNMLVLPSGASVATAGTNFSQLNSVGGSMSLNGTLALNITPGFYATGSIYQLLTATNGITGNFSQIVGANLPFITFAPVGGSYTTGTTTITTTTVATTSGTTTTTTTTAIGVPGAVVGTTTTTVGSTTTTVTTVATGLITPSGSAGIVTTSGAAHSYEFQVQRTGSYYHGLTTGGVAPGSVVNNNELAIAGGNILTGGVNLHNGGLYQLVTTANSLVSTDPTNDVINFVGEVDVLTIAQAQAFLDSISPEGYLAYKAALHDQANAFTRSVALRMDDQNSTHDEDGWWFNTQGEFDITSKAGSTSGYRSSDHIIGMLGGYDFSGPHHVFGLAMNLSWDALSYAPGSMSGTNRDIAFDAYGAYDLGPLVFSGQLAYNLGHMGATKTINLGTVTRTAHGSASENLLKATGTVGLNVLTGDFKLQPFVGIEYANGSISGFTESSAAGLTASDLTVARMSANRTDLVAGVSFARSTGAWRPYVRVAYRNQVGTGTGDTISAYFNADPTSSFTVTGLPEARHEIDANAGVNWVFDDAGALFAGVQGTSRTGRTTVGLNIGVRLEF